MTPQDKLKLSIARAAQKSDAKNYRAKKNVENREIWEGFLAASKGGAEWKKLAGSKQARRGKTNFINKWRKSHLK